MGRERAENARRAAALRAEGLSVREIAGRLGVAQSTAGAWLSDPDGSKLRARKDRYRGRCEVCGAETSGSDGRERAPPRCAEHQRRPAPYWTAERILSAIRSWARAYGERPSITDWQPYLARRNGNEEQAARGQQNIDAGLVPSIDSVYREFGNWNAAIEAAGYEPRAAHGGSPENISRRRDRL